jgi:hypothetical protein
MPPGIGIAAVAGVGCGILLLVTPAIRFEYRASEAANEPSNRDPITKAKADFVFHTLDSTLESVMMGARWRLRHSTAMTDELHAAGFVADPYKSTEFERVWRANTVELYGLLTRSSTELCAALWRRLGPGAVTGDRC